jgi:RNA polymerase sigma-70 factor, ECF subfamily
MPFSSTTEAIWSDLSADLRLFIRRRVVDDHVAEDLLQETFIRIHRSLDSLQDEDRLAAWVYQIARNVVNDHHQNTPLAIVPLDELEHVAGTSSNRETAECQPHDWLKEMVESLPDGYREAVRLGEIDGLPQQAVAERLGLSLSGAKSRIQRGRGQLRVLVEECCQFASDSRGTVTDCAPRPGGGPCCHCCE